MGLFVKIGLLVLIISGATAYWAIELLFWLIYFDVIAREDRGMFVEVFVAAMGVYGALAIYVHTKLS